jgi:transcriptional regulator with XRE-family HTH domain
MSTRGARIKQALEARGVRKQHALASALKVHESAITRWKENGRMSLDSAIALCRELDVSADWLLLGLGSMDQHKSRARPSSTYAELIELLTPTSVIPLTAFIRSLMKERM